MMKHIGNYILTLSLLCCSFAQAQIVDSVSKSADDVEYLLPDDNAMVKDLDLWLRSHILDNWYVQGQLGMNVYNGFEDELGPWLGDNFLRDGRITYSADVRIGRWVFPKVGYRLGLGIGYFHGFLSKETYNAYEDIIRLHSGQGPAQAGYPGYYWESKDPNLLIQRWGYWSVTGDMMIRRISKKNYMKERAFIPYFLLGASFFNTLSSTNSTNDKMNFGAGIHGGLGFNWRFSKHFAIFAEGKISMQSGTFDREWVSGPQTATFNEDFPMFAHIGLEYRFDWPGARNRRRWDFETKTVTDYQFTYSYNTVHIVDTILTLDTMNEFSPEYDSLLIRRAKQKVRDQVDSIIIDFSRNLPNATLADILGSHVLPYEMVFFKLDKWDILPHEELKIKKMASIIRAFPDQTFLLIGSADAKTGSVRRNEFLSVNRSDVVYNQLVHLYGIKPEQLVRIYMGGIMDYDPYELNRATVIIMNHPRVLEEFNKLRVIRQAGGSQVDMNE